MCLIAKNFVKCKNIISLWGFCQIVHDDAINMHGWQQVKLNQVQNLEFQAMDTLMLFRGTTESRR